MSVKIAQLELENVKRIRAVKIEPTQNGLTILGGKNNQGKTSVLDSITWALGGDKYRPSNPTRDGSTIPPKLHIVLSNGIIVERSGKNSDLKVIDPNGNKGGQQLLNEFISQLALDLPKFMAMSGKEKAGVLLQIIGVGEQLTQLERQEQEVYNNRRAVGQIADQKLKFAKEMPTFPDAPADIVEASELIRQQQDILARNGQRRQWIIDSDKISDEIMKTEDVIAETEQKLRDLKSHLAELHEKDKAAQKSPAELEMESTAELEENIRNIEKINIKVRANLDKEKAESDARDYQVQYETMTSKLDDIRKAKTDLLNGANLPLEGLSVEDGELVYNGQKWDNMSSSEQLRVATAIIRKLNPECGFVLLDKLEQLDFDTLNDFGKWLESEGLQAIATRVSTGGECSVIISDGYVDETVEESVKPQKTWQGGTF